MCVYVCSSYQFFKPIAIMYKRKNLFNTIRYRFKNIQRYTLLSKQVRVLANRRS